MIRLRLDPQLTNTTVTAHRHLVAGHQVATDIPLPELEPFRTAGPEVRLALARGGLPADPKGTPIVYRGPGLLGNRWREFACWASAAGYRLAIEGVGEFSISRAGNLVGLERAEPGAAPAEFVESALGPGLILALALQGTWCLHASAVVVGGRAIAFAGESGNGKSTLAASLGDSGATGWQHLADDVLPVEATPDGLEALPHFPQLKLPPDAQPAAGQPERLPLHAIYLLSAPEAGRTAAEVRPLSTREAALALVRHTVAARLFDRDLLARHMAFCSAAAAHVPVRRLAVPRDLSFLPRLRDLLVADLRSV